MPNSNEDDANDQIFDESHIQIPDNLTPRVRYQWENYQNYLFERNLSLTYEKIVYQKKNLFLLSSALAKKNFIDEISRLMNEWIHEPPLIYIAFKAIMVIPSHLYKNFYENLNQNII